MRSMHDRDNRMYFEKFVRDIRGVFEIELK